MALLKKNQQLTLTDGRQFTVVGKLGEGGQGIVYRIRFDDTGEEKALKWYFREKLREPYEFYSHLNENIKVGSPSAAFVWPEQLTEWSSDDSFGYTMRIFPANYQPFSKFLMAQTYFTGARALVNAGLNIVAAFEALHNKGYNYQDLNDGNFAIDPNTGDVLICDNDNVMGHGKYSGVLGKARYMAPEVVRGDKSPDRLTDRYSLAVILFMLLIGDHPLEGRKTNVPALTGKYDRRFFGEEPLFIFDEDDRSNAPVDGLHRNAISFWNVFPSFVQKAFQISFSQDSLLKGERRLLERQWLNVLVRLKSSIGKCPHCGEEIFLESDRDTSCPACNKKSKVVGYLDFGARTNNKVTVPIVNGARLYEYHMNTNSEDYKTETAVIMEKPGKFGLKNDSGRKWTIKAPNGKSNVKLPGEVVVLGIGLEIDFDNAGSATVVSNS